jgi:hypothetical protein
LPRFSPGPKRYASATVVVGAADVDAGVVAMTAAAGGTPVVTSGVASGFRWRGGGATRRGAVGACIALVIRIGRGGPGLAPGLSFGWPGIVRERPQARGGQVAYLRR